MPRLALAGAIALALVLLIAAVLIGVNLGKALGKDTGEWSGASPEQRQWFRSLRSPNGILCCDMADGHRTTWRSSGDGYEVLIEGRWVPVPPEAVVKDAKNPTGESVVWYVMGMTGAVIRCFVPGVEG